MTVRTGYSGNIYALTAYAEANVYYACTPFKMYYGADSVRLTLTNTVANAGTVTIKAEISNGASTPVYSQYGFESTIAMTSGDVKDLLLPFRFCAGDTVKISFKASSVTSDPKLQIDVLAYMDGNEYLLGETAEQVTSASDGTLALTVNSRRKQLVTGSGSNYVISLPAANTLRSGETFTITNASSEFIIVKNSGTATVVFEFVAPGCSIACSCITTSSAAGTWSKCICYPDDFFLDYDNSFHGGLANGNAPTGVRMTIGTGSSYYVTGESYSVIGRGGELVSTLGTDGGGAGYVCCMAIGQNASGTTLLNKGKAFLYKMSAYVGNLSNGTDTYSLKMGLFDKNTGATVENGVYFGTDADGDVIPTTIAATSATALTGLGKMTTATWTDLTFIVNSAGTRVDFWTGKTYGGTTALTIPKTAAMYAGFQFDRVAGTAERALYVDRIRVGMN